MAAREGRRPATAQGSSGAFALAAPTGVSPTWHGALPVAIAAAFAATIAVVGLRGSDFPAHIYLSDWTRHHGLLLWNSNWYGGFPTAGYSVLAPAFGALIGPLGLVLVAGLVAAWLFDRLVVGTFGRSARFASIWFASATATNLIVGRVPFAVGMSVGLGALYALQRRRRAVAVVLAFVCALFSPLAGLFVAMLAAAWAVGERDRWRTGLGIAAAAVAPTLVTAVVFPTKGTFPYEPWAVVRDVATGALVAVVAGRRHQVIRRGALVFMVVALAAFVVHTPVGGNVSRLAQFAAGPVLACLWWPRHKARLAVFAVPLLIWQWLPSFQGAAVVSRVPSAQKAYYEPVARYLTSRGAPLGRVEIPFTERHWEAAYVADAVPLARGWERQIDIAYNPLFYDGTLNAHTYRSWLADNAVEYVAVPDAPLDSSSTDERDLVTGGVPYLHQVWHNAHWRVYRFTGYRGMVRGPGHLVADTPDGFRLRTTRRGVSVVKVHYSPHWAVDGPGCIRRSSDGWTEVVTRRGGEVAVTQALRGTPCPT